MKHILFLLLPIIALALVSCSSHQDKAYKAQREVHEQRLQLIEEYQDCLKKYGDNKEKAEACDQYLKAAEALK